MHGVATAGSVRGDALVLESRPVATVGTWPAVVHISPEVRQTIKRIYRKLLGAPSKRTALAEAGRTGEAAALVTSSLREAETLQGLLDLHSPGFTADRKRRILGEVQRIVAELSYEVELR